MTDRNKENTDAAPMSAEQWRIQALSRSSCYALLALVFRDDSTVWVKRFIEATGLSISNDWDSIPDHIAIELELMQRLTDYEAKLWGSYLLPEAENADKQLSQCLRVQEQFLREHLCTWIPQFCQRVLQTSTSPFYREMAALTKSLVLSDAQLVKAAQTVLSGDSVATCGRHNSLPQ